LLLRLVLRQETLIGLSTARRSDKMAVYRSSTGGSGGGVTITDDGTNYNFIAGGSTIMRIVKTGHQLELDKGVTSDAF